jgi:hypothetical protein
MALPAAARAAGRHPGPVLLLAALVLAAELMPLELGRPGSRDSTTMSQPFAFALVLGWAPRPGWSPLGACSALADLLGGKAARKVLFNSAQLAIALGAAGAVYGLPGARPGRPGCRCPPLPSPRWPTPRAASWSWPTRSSPAGAPASSCAFPGPSRPRRRS